MTELKQYEYYRTDLGVLYCGDCMDILPLFEDNYFDLIITSPPYDNLRDYKEYVFNFEAIAKEMFRVIKKGGVVVWIVGDATINGSETGTSFRQALYFKEIGFNLHDTMIYQKNNPVPMLAGGRYKQCFEYMFILSKNIPNTFNPIQEKSSNLYTRGFGQYNKKGKQPNCNKFTKLPEYKNKVNIFGYFIGGEGISSIHNTKHPAIFPDKLAQDHIISWSNENDLVLDIMCGSGTTCKMAEKLKRRWVGIEISEEYCEISKKRIELESSQGKFNL